MIRNFIVMAALALSVTACASVPNPIAPEARQAAYVEDVTIQWLVDDSDERDDNGDYAAGRDDLITRLESALEAEFANSPAGDQPVTFDVRIDSYSRVNAFTGNVIGGSNRFVADVHVIDAQGETVGVYEDIAGIHASGGGLIGAAIQAASQPDVVGIMVTSFTGEMRRRYDRD